MYCQSSAWNFNFSSFFVRALFCSLSIRVCLNITSRTNCLQVVQLGSKRKAQKCLLLEGTVNQPCHLGNEKSKCLKRWLPSRSSFQRGLSTDTRLGSDVCQGSLHWLRWRGDGGKENSEVQGEKLRVHTSRYNLHLNEGCTSFFACCRSHAIYNCERRIFPIIAHELIPATTWQGWQNEVSEVRPPCDVISLCPTSKWPHSEKNLIVTAWQPPCADH